MKEQLLSGSMAILVQALLSILTIFITAFIAVAVAYINQKKQALIQKIGTEKYNENYRTAMSVYYSVEQQFKGVEAAAEAKRKMFDALLVQRIPGLTQQDIEHFRESIIGKINKEIKDSKLLDPASTTSTTT